MNHATLFSVLVGVGLAVTAPFAKANPAAYPDKPVKIIVGVPAGGSVDMVARLVGQKLADELGQPFLVDNRPGASGMIGTAAAAKAPPDGYTLTVGPAAFMATNKSVFKSLPYDPEADFAPVSKLVNQSMVLVVRGDSPNSSVNQLIADARSKPGKLTYGSAGDGSPHHLGAVLFETSTKVKMTHVPYKGGAPAMTDLLAGTIDVLFSPLPEALPHIKSGRLKALGLLSDKRSPVAADIPTMKEAGAGDMSLSAWMGLFAPANTPPAVVDKLSRAVNKVLAGDARTRLLEVGLEPAPSTPQEMKALLSTEVRQHGELVRASGITPQ